jgi:hypothetical protein
MALIRTAKSCGPDASTLASSWRSDLLATVTIKPDHRGEHEVSRKTIARGMPGVSGVTVVTNARVYYTTRAAAGAPGARHSLRPLCQRAGRAQQNSGALRRGIADLCPSSSPATNPKRLHKGANGSRECAPDDRLRDEAIHTSCGCPLDCFAGARNDDRETSRVLVV